MRIALALVTVLSIACSSSKPRTRTVMTETPYPGATAVATERPSQGDATITASTGDDLSWLSAVYFEFDSSDLTAPTRETLARLHDWLAKHPKTALTIEGHCDEQGTTEYNIGLGQRRAQAMVDYLVRMGIQQARLTSVSFGAERPAVDGHDEVAWSKNRRGEFRVAP